MTNDFDDKTAARDRKTRILMIAVGLLIFCGFSYGSGMEAELHKAKTVNEQRKLAEQDYRDAQRKLRLRIVAVEQLEARRQVAEALGELDRRNFGSAQDRVNRAAALLTQAQAAETNNPDLSAAANALKKTNLAAAADISAERDALVAVASRMDAILDSYEADSKTPGFIKMSINDDEVHPIKNPTMNDVPVLPGNNILRE